MARLDREADVIEASLVVTGLPRAVERLWTVLVDLAAAGTGTLELVVAERSDAATEASGPPLRLFMHRHPPPEPNLPHVGLLAMLAARPRTRLVDQIADGLLVAIDMDAGGAAQARHLLGVVDDVLPMLEHTVPDSADTAASGLSVPRVLIAFGREQDPIWRRLDETSWRGDDDALVLRASPSQPLDVSVVRAALRHLSERSRVRWASRPPVAEPPTPRQDLPASLRDEGERHARDAGAADATPTERAGALLRQSRIYQRAGLAEAGGALLREALRGHDPEPWETLPAAVPLPTELQLLRSWTMPPAAPGGIALLDGGRAMLLALGGALWRLDRHEEAPRQLATLDPHIQLLRQTAPGLALAIGRRVSLVDVGTGELSASVELPARWRERLTAPGVHRREQETGPRVDVDAAADRALLVLPTGLQLYRASTLEPLATLERDDLLSGGLTANGEVLTVHRGGTTGRWTPGSGIVERLGSLGTSVRDASVAARGTRVAALTGVSRQGPRLVMVEPDGTSTGFDVPTAQASSVRASDDGTRILTLEHRLLRVRCLRPEAVARTLLEPPPWMPVCVDATPDGRFVAVLARTYTGRQPLRVNLWG